MDVYVILDSSILASYLMWPKAKYTSSPKRILTYVEY